MIDKFISSRFEGSEKKSPPYNFQPSVIFFVKNNEVIAEVEFPGIFWIKKSIWDVISGVFSLDEDETKIYIQDWLEEHHNFKGLTPYYTESLDDASDYWEIQ